MRPQTAYKQEKAQALAALRSFAEDVKREIRDDKPGIRECINNYADILQKNLPASLTFEAREAIGAALANLASDLHP